MHHLGLHQEECLKIAQVEKALENELDTNTYKKLVIGMMDSRLAALESHLASMLVAQSSCLEQLRELTARASPQAPNLTDRASFA